MAVLLDTAGERTVLTTDLFDYNAAYTVCLWADSNTLAQYATGWYIHLRATAGGLADGIGIVNNPDSGGYHFYTLVNGTLQESVAAAAATTWLHMAMVRESTTALRLYVNGVLIDTVTTSVAGRAAETSFALGGRVGTDTQTLKGRIAHAKVWTTALTAAEIANEMRTVVPRTKLANLWGWWPMLAGDRTRDWSGAGRTLTESGTLADGVDPGIPFSGVVLYPMASGGDGSTPPSPSQENPLHLLRRGLHRHI